MTQPHAPLSVIVPTGNRQDMIEDCLESVRWADELIVVDSFSTDGTLAIARKHADRVLQHEYGFSARQKNWAIPQAAHAWVMIMDTDERVPANLREEICRVLQSNPPYAGYRIPRLNCLFGKEVRHAGYYPDYQVRLFQRDRARYALRRVHAHVLLDGECGTLRSPIVHYAHRSLDQTLSNLLIQMTTWEAEQRRLNAQQAHKDPQKGLLVNLLLRPAAAFALRYLRDGGWRDGYHGLVASLVWSMYVCITYMKIWEKELDLPERWWVSDWQNRHESDAQPHVRR